MKATVETQLKELTEHFTLTDWRKVRTPEYYQTLYKQPAETQTAYTFLKCLEYMKGEAFNTISSFKVIEV